MPGSRVPLDALEFRTPVTHFETRDGRRIPQTLDPVWQRRFSALWQYVQDQTLIVPVTLARDVTTADFSSVLVSNGTFTLTLPARSTPGDTYFFFNNGVGVITIAGTINGNPAGYDLSAQYKYAQITSLDGATWIITGNN